MDLGILPKIIELVGPLDPWLTVLWLFAVRGAVDFVRYGLRPIFKALGKRLSSFIDRSA